MYTFRDEKEMFVCVFVVFFNSHMKMHINRVVEPNCSFMKKEFERNTSTHMHTH